MKGFLAHVRRGRRWLLAVLLAAAGALAFIPQSASAGSGPGTWTQIDVNNAIANGVGYFDANQNPDGSWGSSYLGAETALALASYGVLDSGHFANLSPAQQTRVQNGINWLLSQQDPTEGSWHTDGLRTYDTGLALVALSLNQDVPTLVPNAIQNAIAKGRTYLINNQNITGNGGLTCSSGPPAYSNGNNYCGGWNYNQASGRSDESNTGFALTGLQVTGGLPPAVAAGNVGWQRNVQQLTNNPGGFSAANDGGGSYEPGISSRGDDFSSNANDTGSMLFGYGFDGVPGTDPAVQAGVKFGNDVIDTYELNKSTTRTMIFHTGQNEDGSCVIGQSGCDWQAAPGEGGYHYSLFALVKGLAEYIGPNLSDPNNFYAKAVDLLLSQQNPTDGSWPADPRDDPSVIAATGFAILALGKVATPEQPISAKSTSVSPTEGNSFTGTVATFSDPDSAGKASDYSATISWGDGKTTSGTIGGSTSQFTVSGSHIYAEEGSQKITVTITDTDDSSNTATVTSNANINDAALQAGGSAPTLSGNKASGTVATFTDRNPNGTLADFSATINWGDGSTTTGTVSGASGKFVVSGSHSYAKAGSYTITVTIKDAGGASATATDKVAATVKAAKVKRGSAHLAAVPSGCVRDAFTVQVRGSQIASVRVAVDGQRRHVGVTHRGTLYEARISISPGSHTLTVDVGFRASSKTRSRTFHRAVARCAAPKFTG